MDPKGRAASYRPIVVVAACLATLLAPGLAGAATRIERDLALAPGGRLLVDVDGGAVTVSGADRSGVHVVVTSSSDEFEKQHDVRMEERAGEAVVTIERKQKAFGLFSFGSGSGAKIQIEVPRDTEVVVDTSGGSIDVRDVGGPARLDTSGGSIAAEEIGGDVDADTSGGSIRIARVRGAVRADTSGGGIEIEEVAGDIQADTSGGGIRIAGAGGRVSADTSGGPVKTAFAPGNAKGGELSTSGGGIDVYVDAGVGLEIDAESSGGSVVSDVPVQVQGETSRTALRGRLGAGGATLRLRTSGGGIRIHPLEAR